MRMNSLESGESRVRTVRINDALWERLEVWAARSGAGNAEALRELLRVGLEVEPFPYIHEPHAWMTRLRLPQGTLFVRVKPGADWWDLDEVLASLPGAQHPASRGKGASRQKYVMLPPGSEKALREAFAGRADRIECYRA